MNISFIVGVRMVQSKDKIIQIHAQPRTQTYQTKYFVNMTMYLRTQQEDNLKWLNIWDKKLQGFETHTKAQSCKASYAVCFIFTVTFADCTFHIEYNSTAFFFFAIFTLLNLNNFWCILYVYFFLNKLLHSSYTKR